MGTSNCKLNQKNIPKHEFNIIKNEIIYNIKILSEKNNIIEEIKIIISFVKNNSFQIYEVYLNQIPEIGMINNFEEAYQELIDQIKNENIEIVHDDEGKYILLKMYINKEIKSIKLLVLDCNDKIRLNELIANYISLSENYKQIKKK